MIKLIELLKQLVNNLGYIIVIAFFISRFKTLKQIVLREKLGRLEIIVFSLIFGVFGILGTYIGIDVRGAIANTRNIGVMVGGILCGPFVGVVAGIIAGLHRVAIDIGGITAIPCAIATIVGGYLAGIIYKKSSIENRWIYGLVGGIIIESLSMALILILSKPFNIAFLIVKQIYIPMVIANAGGIAIVILITENIFEAKEEIAAKQARVVLQIANKTLPHFREVTRESLKKVCEIIRNSVEADAVAITDREYILAHVGIGEDHHIEGSKFLTKATEEVIKKGEILILNNPQSIECKNDSCSIKSAIVVPLKDKEEVIGTLKIYYKIENGVTYRDKTLAEGLSQLISTQLELSKLENLKCMANKAEIKALQAQINPHFLFNALHTIASFVRMNPSKARDLIIDLSTYLRYNIEKGDELVSIESELEQVKAYVKIEQARYGDKLKVRYDVDTDIDVKLPSLIIQPLVENSIKHGILNGDENGVVKIVIKKHKEDNTIKIIIEDDGVGIDCDVINNVYNEKMKCNKIGLANVHNRLKLLYGKGLQIERLEQGTRISFMVYKKD
ncbi:sensor histidine kinase [Wukongibacter sp. M2B1]